MVESNFVAILIPYLINKLSASLGPNFSVPLSFGVDLYVVE